jgi:phosphohistidine phosphatase
MSRLYVIRHGKAEKDSATGLDADRELKGRGSRQAAWLAAQLAEGDGRPEIVITSRFSRALATAKPIAEACGCTLEEAAVLEAGHEASSVIEMLVGRSLEGPVAIVGHNPQLSEIVERLCGEEARGMWLRTGEAAVVDFEDGEWRLVGLMRLGD